MKQQCCTNSVLCILCEFWRLLGPAGRQDQHTLRRGEASLVSYGGPAEGCAARCSLGQATRRRQRGPWNSRGETSHLHQKCVALTSLDHAWRAAHLNPRTGCRGFSCRSCCSVSVTRRDGSQYLADSGGLTLSDDPRQEPKPLTLTQKQTNRH